ncbi:hypothetical protein D9758_011759 [Tetrapyrgos nigripes]|uniref:Uncharacterized protein n=1 Tax=Tetrapyrgos nigripes TaxID=182062 RepID=A0A8H5CWQ2_9AGAR|nr:hypothetical protein D9758_011759 [Tetrapyrgos nigripes]
MSLYQTAPAIQRRQTPTNCAALLHLLETSSHLASLVKVIELGAHLGTQWIFSDSHLPSILDLIINIQEFHFPASVFGIIDQASVSPIGRAFMSVFRRSSLKSIAFSNQRPVPDQTIRNLLLCVGPGVDQMSYNGVSLTLRKCSNPEVPIPVDVLTLRMHEDILGYEYLLILASPNTFCLTHLTNLHLICRNLHELGAHREFLRTTDLSLRHLKFDYTANSPDEAASASPDTFLNLMRLSLLKSLDIHCDLSSLQLHLSNHFLHLLSQSLQTLPFASPIDFICLRLHRFRGPTSRPAQGDVFDPSPWVAIAHCFDRPDLASLREISFKVDIPDNNTPDNSPMFALRTQVKNTLETALKRDVAIVPPGWVHLSIVKDPYLGSDKLPAISSLSL